MKKFNYHTCALLILMLTLACAGLSGCETSGTAAPGSTASMAAPPGTNAGRLIIRRAANLGVGLFLSVSIDGRKVTDVGYGETYDGPLSSGQHVLSVILRPNLLYLSPTEKTLTVEKGQTYTLTAMWQGERLVLR
jgi:hypothetical protein